MRRNLISCRNKKGYTQKQFAEMLNITERQYQRIEQGKSDGTIKLWIKIKSLLAQPIDYLIQQNNLI